jgi:Tol biopolymer transport system component
MVMRRLKTLLATGVLAALVALALSACGGGGQENESADSSVPRATNLHGEILFTRQGGKYKDETVFTAEANGAREHRVSDFGGQCCPRLSPDGTRILWSSLAPPDGERITTAIVRADGSHPQKVPLRHPKLSLGPGAWVPDGKQMAFEGADYSNPNSKLNGVHIADVPDGRNLVRLTSNPLGATDLPQDFSPDGSQIVFLRSEPVEGALYGSLYIVNVDGTGLHRITPPGSHTQTARWSPDGKWIVFGSTGSEPNQVIEMVRPDGTGQKKVFEDPDGGSAITPTWSPDGHKIMFALIGEKEYYKAEEQRNNKLCVINEDGKGLAVVLDTPDFKKLADWVAK